MRSIGLFAQNSLRHGNLASPIKFSLGVYQEMFFKAPNNGDFFRAPTPTLGER